MSRTPKPLEFTVGKGQMIAGFDKAVVGMEEGETKKVTIPASEAYGEHSNSMIFEIPKSELPPDLLPKVGDILVMQPENQRPREVVVIAVSDISMTIDANHPLAGKDLTFEITLVEIEK